MRDLACTFSQIKSINMFSMCLKSGVPKHFLWRFIAVWTQNLIAFVYMYVNVWHQTLPEICRNMGIWGMFTLYLPGKIYLGCILFVMTSWHGTIFRITDSLWTVIFFVYFLWSYTEQAVEKKTQSNCHRMMGLKGENCIKQLRELHMYIGWKPTRITITYLWHSTHDTEPTFTRRSFSLKNQIRTSD